jgi:hypothetical protein
MVVAMVMVRRLFSKAPERSSGPVSVWIAPASPEVDDEAAFGQAGERPPRGGVLGIADDVVGFTVDRIARLDLVGVSGGPHGVEAAVLLKSSKQCPL